MAAVKVKHIELLGLWTALFLPASCLTSSLTSSVPTDALANKLFGAPEPSSIARSLPTTVPDSPNYRSARTPRTPRTPHRKDQTMTPRFYPVVKESRPVDAKVRQPTSEGKIRRILVEMHQYLVLGAKTTLTKHFLQVVDPLKFAMWPF